MTIFDKALGAVGLQRKSRGNHLGPLPPTAPMNWFQVAGWTAHSYNTTGGSTVHGCVAAYAQTIAQCPVHHYRQNEDGSRTRLPNSGPSGLIARPNDYQTRSDLMLNLVHSVLYNGNGYLLAVGGNTTRQAESLHLLDPRGTHPERIRSEDGAEIFYHAGGSVVEMFSSEGEAFRIPARYIGHLRLFTPRDPLIGVTPIEAAGAAIAAGNAITDRTAAFHTNASRPSGVLTTELNLTKDQMNQLREAWEEQSKNLNTGGVPILSNGLKWEPLSMSATDAETIGAWKMSVEEIARAFTIPLPVIGSLENATLNNAETLIQLWLSQGLGFLVEHIESMLAKLFGLPVDQGIEIDTSVLLRTNFEGRMKGLTMAVGGGIMSPNEVRKKEHLPPVDGGEMPRMQSQNVPLDYEPEVNVPASPPDADEEISDDEIDQLLEGEDAA